MGTFSINMVPEYNHRQNHSLLCTYIGHEQILEMLLASQTGCIRFLFVYMTWLANIILESHPTLCHNFLIIGHSNETEPK
jgi:hypothetical protein